MGDVSNIQKEYDDVIKELSNPEIISDVAKLETLSKRRAYLEKIVDKAKELEKLKERIEENKHIVLSEEESELRTLAEQELTQCYNEEKILEADIEKLIHGEEEKSGAAIIEIRAGTGGDEAALFCSTLFQMYSKYAKKKSWGVKILESHPSEVGGYKEIIFELKDGDVFSFMQYEGGVHRVQRIPETEKVGRIHTSTVSVAVLPKPKKEEVTIRSDELKIDYYRSPGPGGQNVNKRETAVRITHIPTGLVVTSHTERNQLQNKENAMSLLEAKILEIQKERQESNIAGSRKSQIKGAKRSEKIRTYNFPQSRITDHRIKKSWHNIEEILEGNLDEIIDALKQEDKLV